MGHAKEAEGSALDRVTENIKNIYIYVTLVWFVKCILINLEDAREREMGENGGR